MPIKTKEPKQFMTSNKTTVELTTTDLSNFLDACQAIGIDPDDFDMIIRNIADDVIDAADEYSPTRELKRSLHFLRTIETLLNSIKIQ